MADSERFELRISDQARQDFKEIVKWSLREFGEAAAQRYEALILQSFRDIQSDPIRPGSKERLGVLQDGVRTYHLAFSRKRGYAPKSPRHFLIYRRANPNIIEIARILHDSRDLIEQAPEEYRRIRRPPS